MKNCKLLTVLFILFFHPLMYSQNTGWECNIIDHSTPPSPLAPCPNTSDPSTSENGRHLTPRGTFRILVIYAGFVGNASTDEHYLDGWISLDGNTDTPDLPDYVTFSPTTGINTTDIFFNKETDFDPGGPIDDPTNESASKIWNIMSKPNEDFKLIGEVFSDVNGVPSMVVVDPLIDPETGVMWTDPCDFPNSWPAMNRLVIQNASLMNPQFDWGRFDERENSPQYQCDNSLNPTPDGIIDYVVVVYKYNNVNDSWGAANVPSLTALVGSDCNGNDAIVQEGWQGSGGGIDAVNIGSVDLPNLNQTINFGAGFTLANGTGDQKNVFIHEFAHTAYHCPHFFSSNNVAGDYFYKHSSGWGATAQEPVFKCLTAWERWYLGYIDGIEVTQDGTHELNDFITTGDAIRIEIPNSGEQHLWIENHTGVHEFDTHPMAGAIIGPNNETLSDSPNGIYMYVENIAGNKNFFGFTNVINDGANGVKFINASGNYDFIMDTSIPPIEGTHRSERGQANPISGVNPILRHRDDYDNNGSITYDDDWNAGGPQEHRKLDREYYQSIDRFLYRNTLADTEVISGYNDQSAAFQTGDIIGIGTNPTISNYALYDQGLDAFEPTFLNGLRIEIVSIDNQGKATLDIKFEETLINQDVRWTGNIVLPNITDNTADLIIGATRQLTLNLSGTTNRHTISPVTNQFINPTVMRISSDAELLMEASSNLTIQNHSTLIIEDGAKVELKNAACIVVQNGGVLELQGNDITLDGDDAVIQIQKGGTLRTADGVDFTFKGSGYVSFFDGNIIDLGEDSDFVIERDLATTGKRFIQLYEDATLALIDGHSLKLKYGEILYEKNSKILVTNQAAQTDELVDLFDVDMTYNGTPSTSNGVVGIETLGLESFVAKFINSRDISHTFKIDAKDGWVGTSSFTTNDIGITATNFDYIMLYRNDFRNIDGTSIELETIDIAVLELNTIDEAPSNINYSAYGVDLKQVGFASISNGYIKDCLTGILSEGSNVFLRNGVIISDNVVGVDFGDTNLPNFALTVGDKGCASIINNDVGVRGENIILNIDAIEHAVNNGGTPPKANRFDGNTTLFDICYTALNIVNDNPTILMKGNYWGGGGFWTNTSTFKIDLAFGSPACGTTVNIDDSEFVTSIPSNCDWFMSQTPQTPVPNKVKCEFTDSNNDNVLVHEQARLAFIDLAQDNFTDAKSKYQPIADLSSQDVNYEAACLHKIYFARCMTEGLGNSFDALIARLPNEGNGWEEKAIAYSKTPIESFTIFPNPANDFIFIQNKQTVEFEIAIYNTFGQQVLTSEFTKELNLDVGSFETGIYILDILDKSSKERMQKKIVIQ